MVLLLLLAPALGRVPQPAWWSLLLVQQPQAVLLPVLAQPSAVSLLLLVLWRRFGFCWQHWWLWMPLWVLLRRVWMEHPRRS